MGDKLAGLLPLFGLDPPLLKYPNEKLCISIDLVQSDLSIRLSAILKCDTTIPSTKAVRFSRAALNLVVSHVRH